jgi:hypothetical protein
LIRVDVLLGEQEGHLTYMQATYKICIIGVTSGVPVMVIECI